MCTNFNNREINLKSRNNHNLSTAIHIILYIMQRFNVMGTGTVNHLPFNAKMYQQHFLFAGGYKIIMTNHIETIFMSFSCFNIKTMVKS